MVISNKIIEMLLGPKFVNLKKYFYNQSFFE